MTDSERVEAVMRAVERLSKAVDPSVFSDGLSPSMSALGLEAACALITRSQLRGLQAIEGKPPATALVVVARGVFTAPLEWVAGLAVLGTRVVLKAPSASPSFCEAVADSFVAEGLAVEVRTGHALPAVDAVVAMGSDASVALIGQHYSDIPMSLHGHRFSVELVSGAVDVEAVAQDIALYDGRGCFTPTGIFVLGAPADAEAVGRRLADALEHAETLWPRGHFDPALGPIWRERLALSRVKGRVYGGATWGVSVGPCALFEPSALPRWITVHAVSSVDAMLDVLAPWRQHWAACATDEMSALGGVLEQRGFERVCEVGKLQRPRFGRPHGGSPFLRDLFVSARGE